MNLFLFIARIAFSGLSLPAAVSQLRAEKRSLAAGLMTGGSLPLAAVVCNFAKPECDFVFALTGCAAICVSAVRNGLKSGNFHMRRHIIRIALPLILPSGFILL